MVWEQLVPGAQRIRWTPRRLLPAGDERLAQLVQSGSEDAFAALYGRYHQRLYRYCRSLLGNDNDAQDALQSTFANAFVALAKGRRNAPVRPWLYRIAHNESISIVRHRGPEVEISEQHLRPAPSAAEVAGEHDRLSSLTADLRDLTERQRAALVLRELGGLSHAEIASVLAIDPAGAKQTIFEARRSLQEFAEGRAMVCDEVCKSISSGGGRALRGAVSRPTCEPACRARGRPRRLAAQLGDRRARSGTEGGVGTRPLAAAAAVLMLAAGCGAAGSQRGSSSTGPASAPAALVRESRPIGRGPRFHPPARGPVIGICRRALGARRGVHVEVFAANRVLLVAAGIGTRPPRRRFEGRISGAACYGRLVTAEPTGVVLVGPGRPPILAALFRSWGQPLSRHRLAGFGAGRSGRVAVFVNGVRWDGPPGAVPLKPHAEIVLEVGPHVPPHAGYTFPPGT